MPVAELAILIAVAFAGGALTGIIFMIGAVSCGSGQVAAPPVPAPPPAPSLPSYASFSPIHRKWTADEIYKAGRL